MAELLSHVLVAYAIATAASWRIDRLTRRWVAVATVGALLPDLNRLSLVVADPAVEAALGVPFRVDAVHTLGGVALLAGVGAMAFATHRRRAFALLFGGGVSHLLVDAGKAYADGAAGAWLYPLTWHRHPTPGVYVSSEPTVLATVAPVAVGVWLADRYVFAPG